MYVAKNQSWWKVLCKKTRAVGYKVIELAKFTEDMKKEFYLVGESLLGNNAKKNCNAQNVRNELSPTRSQCRKKNTYFITSWSFTYLLFYIYFFSFCPFKSLSYKINTCQTWQFFNQQTARNRDIRNSSLVSLF